MRVLFRDLNSIVSRTAAAVRRLGTTIHGPVLWLTVCGALLVAAIFAGTIITVGEFRERALANSERELQNTVLLLTRHFDQQFEDSDTIAADVISRLRIPGIASPQAFRELISSSESHEILRSKAGVLSYLGDISIYDADGDIINWSRPLPTPALNISERSYFKSFKFNPQSATIQTEAVRSLISGNLNTVVAHRLTGEDGVFLGVMTRRINPSNYVKFFASVAIGPDAAVSMFHADGTLLARHPRAEHLVGQKFRSAPLLQRVLTQGGQQTLRVKSPIDSRDRLGSAAQLQPLPDHRRRNQLDNRRAGRLAGSNQVPGQRRRRVGSDDRVDPVPDHPADDPANQEAQQRLESERQRLDTALNNMIQGLVMYDASARIVPVNQRYIDMFDLSPDIVKPGCHFHDLIQHRKDRGAFSGDVKEFCPASCGISHRAKSITA